jgi:site-specific recombinase XerD
LRLKDLNNRQSKSLQDRVVYLSPAGVEALRAYVAIRGPAATDHVFIHRHRLLSSGYCNHLLRVCGQRCGVSITGQQLRYSMATLLLNAGLPVLTLQRILGTSRWRRR